MRFKAGEIRIVLIPGKPELPTYLDDRSWCQLVGVSAMVRKSLQFVSHYLLLKSYLYEGNTK